MKERVLTGSMIFLVVVFAVLARVFSLFAFDAFVVALMVLSSIESSRLFAEMNNFNNKKIVVLFPIILYGFVYLFIRLQLDIIWSAFGVMAIVIALTLVAFVLCYIFKNKTENEMKVREFKQGKFKFALSKSIHTLMAFLYPAIGLIFFVLLNRFSSIVEISSSVENKELIGLVAILLVFVITVSTDIFSMIFGSVFGKRKLAPKVSPNKTIEGAFGGVIFAILISIFAFVLLGAFETFASLFYNISFNLWKVIALSAVGAVVSICGDLFESLLKRKANVKDSGTFLPGHGGFLDRFDGYIFNVVWVFMFFLVLL